MYHRLYLHLVWTTRGRARLIDAPIANFLCRVLRAVARKEQATVLQVGIVQTHVHVLVRTHPTRCISHLVQRLKGVTSVLSCREGLGATSGRLFWAKGYSVQTVSIGILPQVRGYLRAQPRHHPDEAIPGWRGDVGAEHSGAMV